MSESIKNNTDGVGEIDLESLDGDMSDPRLADGVLTEEEIEEMLDEMERPHDVLKFPLALRRRALDSFKEKVVDRYYDLLSIQESIFDYIDSHEKGGKEIDFEKLEDYAYSLISNSELDIHDVQRIEGLLKIFKINYQKMRSWKDDSDQLLIRKCSSYSIQPFNIKGEYRITRSPYSFHFSFRQKDDYIKFVGDRSTLGEKSTGIYFREDDIPITAEFDSQTLDIANEGELGVGSSYESDTFIHERQHRKFHIANALSKDKIEDEEKDINWERKTRDELLAYYIEGKDLEKIKSTMDIYEIPKESGMDPREYSSVFDNALEVIKQLEGWGMNRQTVVYILQAHDMRDWPKVLKRLKT